MRISRAGLAVLAPLCGTLGLLLVAEVAHGRRVTPPKSLVHELSGVDALDHRVMGDLPAVQERAASSSQRRVPLRVAVAMPLRQSPDDAGTWERLPDGGRVWRLRVSSPGAAFLSFKFSEFELPEGAELHFVAVSRDYHDGPYTHRHNRPARRFGSPMIPGDSAVIELFLPREAGPAQLALESVSHGTRDVMGMAAFPTRGSAAPRATERRGGGTAGRFSCQRDVNCPEGAAFQDLKRAVAEGFDGEFVCSGQLVNNARQDGRYLYLTAAHCEWWRDPATITYYWNYENSGCDTSDAGLTFSTGSTDLYHSEAADIDLLELDGTDLEANFDVYFLGWNRSTEPPPSGAIISFPADKPKQIALESDPITDCAPGGCPEGFGPNFWRVEGWDVGVTEQGSSGGGLLNPDDQLVGVLSGGIGADCIDFEWDEFAKIDPEWANLQPFLDPDATGALSLPGIDEAVDPPSGVPSGSGWARATLLGLLLLAGGWASRRGAAH